MIDHMDSPPANLPPAPLDRPVVIYDGACAYCRRQIDRIRRRDADDVFAYVPRQTPGLEQRFPARVCYHKGYNEELAHVIEAAADMLLMPSRYEPCGLNQMFSLRYGTIPIVRRTGGLADSVRPFDPETCEGTGFVFEHFTADGLRYALRLALETYLDRKAWSQLMQNAMGEDFSWERQARRYLELYSKLAGNGTR